MINPAQYIAFIETLNVLEEKAKKVNGYGLPIGTDFGFLGFQHYSVEWDSQANRWTLLSETDDAPDLCSFNQTKEECSETDLCEQCWQVQQALAEEQDNAVRAYRGL